MKEVKNIIVVIATEAGSGGLPVEEADKFINAWLEKGYTIFSCNVGRTIGASMEIHLLLVK